MKDLNVISLNTIYLNKIGIKNTSNKESYIEVCTKNNDFIEVVDAKENGLTKLILNGGYEVDKTPSINAPSNINFNCGKIYTRDSELPAGYCRLSGIIMNDDTYYSIDGFRLKGNDTLKVSFTANKACNILGCYTTADADDNYSIFASTSSGAKYLRYNGGTYLSAITANKRYDITITPTGATGFGSTSKWEQKDFTSSTDMLIGSTSVNATSAKMSGTIHGSIEVVGRAKFIPCKRIADGVIGYYDTYSNIFYEPSVGNPVAENYDLSKVELIVGDSPETLEITAVYDSRLPKGYIPVEYIESNGVNNYIDTGIVINNLNTTVECDFQMTGNTTSTPEMVWGYMDGASNIPRWGFGEYTTKWLGSPNNTTSVGTSDLDRHTCVLRIFTANDITYYDGTLDEESIYNKSTLASYQAFEKNILSIYLFARNNKNVAGNFATCRIYSFKVYTDGKLAHDLVPCKDKNDIICFYDAIGKVFVTDLYNELDCGEESTNVVTTANVENLFAVDRYINEQDLVKGIVTRRAGMLVFNGTEKWTKATNSSSDGNAVFYIAVNDRANNDTSLKLMSSHYSFKGTVSYSTLKSSEMSITQTTKNIYFDGGTADTKEKWISYLEEQYAAGTPVIVVYPLAEEKTESVTPQPIKLIEGYNTITRISAVSGLEMTCCYKQKPKEEEGGGLIKFYVQHSGPYNPANGIVEYTAEKGMTWKEFCESEYNVNGFTAYEYNEEGMYELESAIYTYDYSDGMWGGYEEWGWLVPTEDDWWENKILPNQTIIADTTYYEVWDSVGINGGWG